MEVDTRRGADDRVHDEGTFESFVAARSGALYRTAFLLTGQHSDAEDLLQVTLVKLYVAWNRARAAVSTEAYARTVLTHTFVSSRRPRRFTRERLVESFPEHPAPVVDHDDRMTLWSQVVALPPRQRAVVVLRYYEDLSEAEIAGALGCSRGTVKSTASTALRALRSRVEAGRAEEKEEQ